MSYQAIYRAWRPQTFADLVGQPHVKQTLTNAILRGHVAHAYLFSGPRGTGKTSAAKVLARAVNCHHRTGPEPCNVCPACLSILSGSSVDVEEIDAASNRGVDEIRQLREKVQYAPADLDRKVYIVDEVHMLTTEAFNALLKTLEEPPSHTLFVLATTEPHKIPGTIVSRCQRFDFRRIAPEEIVDRLRTVCDSESWTYEDEALWRVAEVADGGLRDALSLLEQTAAFGQGQVTAANAADVLGGVQTSALLTLVAAMVNRDYSEIMHCLMEWYSQGKDPARIVHEILQVLRDLFIVKLSSDDTSKLTPRQQEMKDTAELCSTEWLLTSVSKLGETYMGFRHVDQPRLALESAVLGLTAMPVASFGTVPATAPATAATAPGMKAAAPSPVAALVDTAATDVVPAGTDGAQPESQPEPRKPERKTTRRTGGDNSQRKLEILQGLDARSRAELLQRLQDAWPDILQQLRSIRIQTHAWMMGGTPVLVTDEHAVLAFASRIHRDAVMKPEERSVIEPVLSEFLGLPTSIMALVQADWDAYLSSKNSQPTRLEPASPNRLVNRTVEMFGKDVVEVIEGE